MILVQNVNKKQLQTNINCCNNFYQVLEMKINFDELEGKAEEKTPPRGNGRKIDIEIESPIYEKIVKSVSPHSFK